MNAQIEAIAIIEEQQKAVQERSPQWMVGEQLKDICRREPASAAILLDDLRQDAMSITEAEKQIKTYADEHQTNHFACVTPIEADEILRNFYGLTVQETAPTDTYTPPSSGILDLADFL